MNVDVSGATTGLKSFSWTPRNLAMLSIKSAVAIAAQFIEQREKHLVAGFVVIRSLEPGLGGSTSQSVEKLLLLTR
ncbi:hypothetical protein D3C87_2130360 [compost metagenome]